MTASTLPRLPTTAWSPLGPLRVKRQRAPTVEGDHVLGSYDPNTRIVVVALGLTRETAWNTFFHEQAHAHLDDLAVVFEDDAQEERVCDVIAAVRMAEFRAEVSRRARARSRRV